MIKVLILCAVLGDPSPSPSRVLEVRAELRASAPNAYGSRVEIVRRMLVSGLVQQSSDELERILRATPDERHVLALLDEPDAYAALAQVHVRDAAPESGETTRSALLRAGARASTHGASPLKREIVVRALAQNEAQSVADEQRSPGQLTGPSAETASSTEVPPRDPRTAGRKHALNAVVTTNAPLLLDDLTCALSDGVTTRRAFACFALRRLYSGRALGQLAVRAVVDPALAVRDEAILALRDSRDPAACGAVVRALASPQGKLRARAAEALGRMGYREAVEPLVLMLVAAAPAPSGGGSGGPVRANLYSGLSTAYVKDYDLEIAQGASIANPIVEMLTTGVVFDVGVAGTSSLTATTEAWDASLALTRLTGQRFGLSGSAWQKWWLEHRDKYVPAARRTPKTGGD